MVKAYLRFEHDKAVGVVTSRECNVAFDETGRFALTGAVESVGIWNLRQGVQEKALVLANSTDRVSRLCMQAGGLRCAAGYLDGTVRIWDLKAHHVLQTFQGHRSAVTCFAFDKAGQLLASGSNDTDLVVWDLVNESGLARLKGHVDAVTAVTFWEAAASPVRLISASKDRLIRIWSLEMQICLQALAEHTEVYALALNEAQTRLAAGSSAKFLHFWSLDPEAKTSESGDLLLANFLGAVPRTEGQGHALTLQFAHVDHLEVLLCQGSGRTLEVFRVFSEQEVSKRKKRRERRAKAKLRKKGTEAGPAGAADVEAAEEQEDEDAEGSHAADEITPLQTHRCSAKALSMAWNPKTKTVLLGLTNNLLESVRITASEEGAGVLLTATPTLEFAGHRTGVRALAVAMDDSMFMSLSSESVKIWSASTGRCVRTLPSGYGLCGFFLAGNEHVLIGTKEGSLELYDIQIGELSESLEAHSGAVYGLALRPDQKGCASGSADRTLRFFDFEFTKGSQKSVKITEQAERSTELPDEILAVAYSANSKYVNVALLNHTVVVLFEDSLKFYLSLYGHRLPVMALDVSDDSQMIASGSADKNVRLWSCQFGNCLKSLKAHSESVMQVRFLPGTHYLATAGRDHMLKLWDCDSYELITSLQGHACEILAMALSQDAAFIVTAGNDKQIRMWKRTQEQLFLSEERAKELEDQFEQEVEREDLPGAATAPRPSRRTVESVRTTERLMEVLDEAKEAEEQLAAEGIDEAAIEVGQGARHPCARAIAYINTLNASNIYEVLLALPFAHALQLLKVILRFLEAVASLPGGEGAQARGKALSAAATLQTPCQAALIAAYVHHSELAATSSCRPILMRLKSQMQLLLQAEKDRIGLTMAGLSHLQSLMKRSGLPTEPQAAAPRAPKKAAKRRRAT
ncbi:WD repeat-containing protein 3 [Durusdinium trenchii]|uniref:WD repeat-containing protein 3 n=1 Tax=Durusdinium trenchii TaxID=1381693 RepID=A0ABP0JXD9_9DINO